MTTSEGTENRLATLNETGAEMRAEVKAKARDAAASANGYVDAATTRVGRTLESAATSVTEQVDRAADGVTRAGRYLQANDPRAMGRDLGDWVREHPAVPLSIGFGVGLLVGRALARG